MIQKDWIPETLALESLAVTVGGTILLGERERILARSLLAVLHDSSFLRSSIDADRRRQMRG